MDRRVSAEEIVSELQSMGKGELLELALHRVGVRKLEALISEMESQMATLEGKLQSEIPEE